VLGDKIAESGIKDKLKGFFTKKTGATGESQ
jgi:hypothetical protein